MSSFVLRLLTRVLRKRPSPFAGAAGCRTSSDACRTPARGCGTECSGRFRASTVTRADTGPEVVSASELFFLSAIRKNSPGTQRVILTWSVAESRSGAKGPAPASTRRKDVSRAGLPGHSIETEPWAVYPIFGDDRPYKPSEHEVAEARSGMREPGPKDGAPGPRTVFQPNGSSWVVRGCFMVAASASLRGSPGFPRQVGSPTAKSRA
jgi:hypothetical protein